MWSVTPKPGTAKTVLAPRVYLPILLLLAVVVISVGPWLWKNADCSSYLRFKKDTYRNDRQLAPKSGSLKLELVTTTKEQTQGLSGRPCLPNDQGMLLDFGWQGFYPIWMKNMKFPIDIIWLNSSHTVTDLELGVSPATYPQKFVNSKPAQYVLELGVGQAANLNISQGTTLKF